MVVHFRSEENKRYPKSLCNKAAWSATISDNFSECTCKVCIRSHLGREERREVDRLFKIKRPQKVKS